MYYVLHIDYFNPYVDRVGKVTEAEVKLSAAQHLRPNQAVYLVVGDGDAPMIHAVDKKYDVELKKGDKRVTLREALTDLAASGDVGKGGLVELDADGRVVH